MTKFFKKPPKNIFWGQFGEIWSKMNFRGKDGQFLNIPIIYLGCNI